MFKPTAASLKAHVIPDWYHDAKLGIFIHWGLYSVPGWAVPEKRLHGVPKNPVNSPYSEWYQNMLRIKGSTIWEHHRKTYGTHFTYDDFAPVFKREAEKMNAGAWASFIIKTGAHYTVIVTKHHDGFALWPSIHKNPRKASWHTERDCVGELCEAARRAGLRFGVYYSGILDWTFQRHAVADVYDEVLNGVSSPSYARYCFRQYMELIDRYRPDILWNDIGYPQLGGVKRLLAYYYNTVPEGVVNNRWRTWLIPGNGRLYPVTKKLIQVLLSAMPALRESISSGEILNQLDIGDYATPEFDVNKEIVDFKWETTMGLGSSYGYNQNEDESNTITGDELIRLFVDIVSKNGNLLVNIGPRADGSIPEVQRKPLLALGAWLKKNGRAIYGTRPWTRAAAVTEDGTELRFTRKDNEVFIFLMGRPPKRTIAIPDFSVREGSRISLVESGRKLAWKMKGKSLVLSLPVMKKGEPVTALRVQMQGG